LTWGELLGLIGGGLITIGFIPQVLRVFRLKSAYEISLPFTSLFLLGATCWLVYGVSLGLMAVVLWNGIAIAFLVVLLCAKLKYGMKKRK